MNYAYVLLSTLKQFDLRRYLTSNSVTILGVCVCGRGRGGEGGGGIAFPFCTADFLSIYPHASIYEIPKPVK